MLTGRVTQMKLKQLYSFYQYSLKCDVNQLKQPYPRSKNTAHGSTLVWTHIYAILAQQHMSGVGVRVNETKEDSVQENLMIFLHLKYHDFSVT